jgi:hypothetical protein
LLPPPFAFFLFFDDDDEDEDPFTLAAAEDVPSPFGFPFDPLYVDVGVGACEGVVCTDDGAGESYNWLVHRSLPSQGYDCDAGK